MKHIIKIIVLLSVICTITNFVPLSITVLVLTPLALLGIFYRENIYQMQKVEFYLLLLFVYLIISTLCYDPESFLEFDFYRRDGNFFISYMVLLVFIFLPVTVTFDTDRIFKYVFPGFALLSAAAYVAIPPEVGGVSHFLFESHNAAGGFYSVIAGIAVGFFLVDRTKANFLYSIIFLFMLDKTDSRGSVLALIVAVCYYFVKFRSPALILVLFVLVQFIIINQTYPVWVSMGKVMSDVGHSYVTGNFDFARASTFIDRLYYLWPRAYDNFLHSPIVGLGFGSYDDLYYKYIDLVPHVFAIKDGGWIRHSEGHAHNSMFNILAETGVVGFALFVMLFHHMNRKIKEMTLYDRKLGTAIAISFWTCVFSAATEHRITTPSQMVPFFLIFGIGYMKYCKREKQI